MESLLTTTSKSPTQWAKSPKKQSVGVLFFFLTKWHCILSAELTKTHTLSDCSFGDFAHWEKV